MSRYRQFEPNVIYRNKATGATSRFLRDVLPNRLTVSRGYRRKVWECAVPTLFREIETLTPRETLDAEGLELLDAPFGTREMTYSEHVAAMANCIRGAIESTWNPDKFHFVFHSGGWDSRIISATIRNLYGPNIGNVLFACFGSESDVSWRVLEAEGWRPEQYIGCPDTRWALERCTNLYDAGHWLNGVTLQIMSFGWVLIDRLQSDGLIPCDDDAIQVYTGRNEPLMGATMPGANAIPRFYQNFCTTFLAGAQYKARDVVYPLASYDVMRTALESSTRVDWSNGKAQRSSTWRRDVGVLIDERLAGIPYKTLSWPRLEPWMVDRMRRDYLLSWYGKTIWSEAAQFTGSPPPRKHAWWGAFSAAALCEALIDEGYDLQPSDLWNPE